MTPQQAAQAFAGRTYADETAAMADLERLFNEVTVTHPQFELHETDHGIDGWDAKSKLVGRFTTKAKAEAWLVARGFNHRETGWYWHIDPARRHTMNAITYEIRAALNVPIDPT